MILKVQMVYGIEVYLIYPLILVQLLKILVLMFFQDHQSVFMLF